MSRGMKSSAKNIQMTSFEDLFQSSENTVPGGEKVQEIALTELFPFRDHPFKVLDDEAMADTVESVKSHGVLVPGIARPRAGGGYELVSGHRRKRASELAGLETMPVIVREMDDDEAVLMMVDSNLQREDILPSEKAWAYRMKLEAIKRKAGRPAKGNSRQVGENLSVEEISANSNDSARNIHRFIRLTELVPSMLQLVDDKKLLFNPAVELSYLAKEEQVRLSEKMAELSHVPSLEQAKRLRKFSQEGKLGEGVIEAILTEERKAPPQVTLKGERLRQYFSEEYTQKQIEDVIISLLETWKKDHD